MIQRKYSLKIQKSRKHYSLNINQEVLVNEQKATSASKARLKPERLCRPDEGHEVVMDELRDRKTFQARRSNYGRDGGK